MRERATVEVYCTDLEEAAAGFDRFAGMLSEDERNRAGQFRFERDRRCYILRRGRLREILASHLDKPPQQIRLVPGMFGKPCVRGEKLTFSLSHSRRILLIAVSNSGAVGCDVERRDPRFPCKEVAEQFFSPREARALSSLPAARQAEAFFARWTCKEAYLKARGVGLAVPLNSFDVAAAPTGGLLLQGCEGWSVRSFEPARRYHAAVVAQGNHWSMSLR